MEDFLKQLKDLKGAKPKSDWVKTNREILLSQIRGQEAVPDLKASNIRYWDVAKVVLTNKILAPVARPLTIAVLAVAIVLTSGIAGVSASKASLPGDVLYPVKLTSEKLQVSFTGSSQRKAELYLDFAQERMNEIEKIKQDENFDDSKIEQTADKLKKNIEKASARLEDVTENKKSDDAVELAKNVDEKLEVITEQLNTMRAKIGQDPEARISLDEAAQVATETSVQAVEVIIEKYSEIEDKPEAKELKDIIEKKIDRLAENIEKAKVDVENVVEVIINSEDNEGAEDAAQTEENVTEQKNQQAEDILDEASADLNQGDLDSAIEKIKQTTKITSEVQDSLNTVEIIINE